MLRRRLLSTTSLPDRTDSVYKQISGTGSFALRRRTSFPFLRPERLQSESDVNRSSNQQQHLQNGSNGSVTPDSPSTLWRVTWPQKPRSIFLVKKPGDQRNSEAITTFAQFLKLSYPAINVILEDSVKAELGSAVDHAYTAPAEGEQTMAMLGRFLLRTDANQIGYTKYIEQLMRSSHLEEMVQSYTRLLYSQLLSSLLSSHSHSVHSDFCFLSVRNGDET